MNSLKHILICDDDSNILEIYQAILGLNPIYSVTTLDTCDSVLKCLQESTTLPDLLILDFWIADQESRELILQLRAYEQFKNIPIILVSATSDIATIAKELQVNSYLPKPFLVEELESKVEEILNK